MHTISPRAIEVERVSEQSVWIDGRRCALQGEYFQYWDTKEKALRHIEARLRRRIEAAQTRLRNAEKELERFLKEEKGD